MVFLFPGSNSFRAEAIGCLTNLGAWNEEILEHASDIVHSDLAARFRSIIDPDPVDIRLGVFLANYMFAESLRIHGVEAGLSAGLSLGEYNHLVHIGALAFEDALRVLAMRDAGYEQNSRGVMAEVNAEMEQLCEALARVRNIGLCQIAIHGGPRHFTVAGEENAVELLLRILDEDYGVDGSVIESRFQAHTTALKGAASEYLCLLKQVDWKRPSLPYLPNAVGRFIPDPDSDNLAGLTALNLCSPVLWRESIDFLLERFPELTFIEVGPGQVLYDLLERGWPSQPRYKTDNPHDFSSSFYALPDELTNAGTRASCTAENEEAETAVDAVGEKTGVR